MNVNMNEEIKKELEEFQEYHKNIINVIFHILCGFLFMTFFFLHLFSFKTPTEWAELSE